MRISALTWRSGDLTDPTGRWFRMRRCVWRSGAVRSSVRDLLSPSGEPEIISIWAFFNPEPQLCLSVSEESVLNPVGPKKPVIDQTVWMNSKICNHYRMNVLRLLGCTVIRTAHGSAPLSCSMNPEKGFWIRPATNTKRSGIRRTF